MELLYVTTGEERNPASNNGHGELRTVLGHELQWRTFCHGNKDFLMTSIQISEMEKKECNAKIGIQYQNLHKQQKRFLRCNNWEVFKFSHNDIYMHKNTTYYLLNIQCTNKIPQNHKELKYPCRNRNRFNLKSCRSRSPSLHLDKKYSTF